MATIPYRYSDGTIYIQGMQNNTTDKANILLARADWRADGVVPTEEFDEMFEDIIGSHFRGSKEGNEALQDLMDTYQ